MPGTEHGDWWSMYGWWIFAGTAAVSLLSSTRRKRTSRAEALPGVRVGTVDKFQGQQAPVVFFSMTSSSGDDVPRVESAYGIPIRPATRATTRWMELVPMSMAASISGTATGTTWSSSQPRPSASIVTVCAST